LIGTAMENSSLALFLFPFTSQQLTLYAISGEAAFMLLGDADNDVTVKLR
jgi:uncharacterized protein YgiB involved in biofilm formation